MIRPGAIGDCVLALPALECLRADYTEVWTPSAVAPLIRFADRVRAIAATGLSMLGLPDTEPAPSLLEALRTFDEIVSWYGAQQPEFVTALTAVGPPVRFFCALPPPDACVHAADWFAAQVGCATPAIPRIPVVAEPHNAIVIHPFSGSARKNWPLERYRELAARLPGEVRWCAGPEETLDDAVRLDNLYQLACWLAGARLYIGNDSGITHLAAAAGARVLALFGPTDPTVWGPRGEGVRVLRADLQGLSVEEVLAAACAALKIGSPCRES